MRALQEEPSRSPEPPMTLDQARATMWLPSYHRPMGELLDEGYLDRGRLEWAAGKAQRPIREAAAVLLAWLEQAPAKPRPAQAGRAVKAGITVEQALETPWPFPPFRNQAMGPLVDTRRLGPKDLGYAIQNAWDQRVRQAAIALMAVSLNQSVEEPPPSAGPLKVVSGGRSYAESQQIRLSYLAGVITGVLPPVALLIFYVLLERPGRLAAARPSQSLQEVVATPLGIVAVVIALLLLALVTVGPFVLASWSDRKLSKRIAAYRRGQEGETRVVETLCSVLDGSWTLFRNVSLPGRRRGDLDLVLVGPAGVRLLEVKNLEGVYRNVGERWEYRAGQRWRPYRKSPSRQAQNGAARLANFLRADGIKQWVEATVVWAAPESPLSVEDPAVAVWPLERLPDEVGNLWQDRKVDESTQTRIAAKLTRLCEAREQR